MGGTGEDRVLALRAGSQRPERLYTSPNGPLWNMYMVAVDVEASPPGPPGPLLSPLGWSCGVSGSTGGLGALALGALAVGVLRASRRRPRA